MPRRAKIEFVSLRSSLVNLPISVYGPLVEHQIRPQALAVHILLVSSAVQRPTDSGSANNTPRVQAYVGWTGLASSSSLARFRDAGNSNAASADNSLETLEIDPQFAGSLGLHLGDIVELGLLHDLPIATTVVTEPYSSDDWEIIELHASYVEQNLLSQVRVACVGQEVDVWVFGRTRARLRVVSFEPADGKRDAVLLGTDTEVSIAPKKRVQPNKAGGSAAQNAGSAATGTAKYIRYAYSRALPSRLYDLSSLSSPNTPSGTSTPSTDESATSSDKSTLETTSTETAVAWVSLKTFWAFGYPKPKPQKPKDWTQKRNPLLTYDEEAEIPPPLKTEDCFGPIYVHEIKAPVDPLGEDTGALPILNNGVKPDPTPRVIHSKGGADGSGGGEGAKESGDGNKSQEEKEPLVLRWSGAILDGQVVFQGYTGIKDWGRCLLLATRDSKLLKARDPEGFTLPKRANRNVEHGLVGVDKMIHDSVEALKVKYIMHQTIDMEIQSVWGILIFGRPGSGKTSTAHEIAKIMEASDFRTHIIYVDFSKYVAERAQRLRALFKYLFDKADYHKPSVLMIDNMDRLIAPEVEHADGFRPRQIAEMFISVFAHRPQGYESRGITIIATAKSDSSLHPRIMTSHIFRDIFKLTPPGRDARKEILERAVQARLDKTAELSIDPDDPIDYLLVSTETEGFLPSDLRDLVSRAVHQAVIRCKREETTRSKEIEIVEEGAAASTVLRTLKAEDFEVARKEYVPVSLKDVKLQQSDVSWADIGGLKATRHTLRETLEWPTKYAAIFAKCPLRLRSGILLYGYPGCGKTLLASAVAKECGLNFISVKGPELLDKYIGASEKSVRELFERASAAKPCVLFFDEFDSIAPKRGHDSTGVTDRVVNQMLTQMDGAEGLDGVYVLAATSRPDLIDPALLRPGRLDKSLLCDMPNLEDREEILRVVARKVRASSSIDFRALAQQTEGYSGADLQALIYNAHLQVVHETLKQESSLGENGEVEQNVGNGNAVGTGSTGSKGKGKEKAENNPEDGHSADSATSLETKSSNDRQTNGPKPLEFITFGGGDDEGTSRHQSRAEQEKLQKKIRRAVDSYLSRVNGNKQTEATEEETKERVHEILDVHLQRALTSTQPSVSRQEQARLRHIYEAFLSSREGNMNVPPDTGPVGSRATLM